MTTATRLVPSDDPNAYARWVRRQRAYGRWQPFIDAQPARDHALHVMATADIGWRRLADLAGVPRPTVTYLLYGRNGQRAARISPDNARKLLAVQADGARGITIPAVGTQRRIHVLIGEGWPQIHLGPQFGTHPQYVNQILRVQRVTVATAEAVADTYQRLRGADPTRHGATAHGINLAKTMAARNNWPDRVFWEDMGRIDDPAFDPAAVSEPPKYMRLGEDALWLREQGFSRHQIANRLGESVDYMDQIVKRYLAATATEPDQAAA